MENNKVIFALDIGTRTVIGVAAEVTPEGQLNILKETLQEHGERSMLDGQIHDIAKVAEVVAKIKGELEEAIGFKLTKAAIAAAGRALYTVTSYAEMEVLGEVASRQVFELESRALAEAMETIKSYSEVRYELVGYSVLSYYLDGYPFKALEGHRGKKISVELVATFLPETVTSSLQAVLMRCGLEPLSLTLEPIAAINAAVPDTLRLLNIALVDVGAGTSDIAICRDGAVIAYGMVPEAGDEITEEIMRQFLVDFAEAEKIKREIGVLEEVSFYDILGQEIVLPSREIYSKIEPVVERIAEKIAEEMVRLNGGTPKAVYLVGGGAKTPGLGKLLASKLGLEPARVAVKGVDRRERKIGGVLEGLTGPEGVTVLGILLTALKKYDLGFFSVYLNGREVKLLSRRNITVGEILKLSGITTVDIFGSEGKGLYFYLNGVRREVKGGLPRVAEIFVNGMPASLKTEVTEGDSINFVAASKGEEAKLTVKDLLKEIREVVIKVNGEDLALTPLITIEGTVLPEEYQIKEGDSLTLTSRETLFDLFKEKKILLNGKEVQENVSFYPGDVVIIGDEVLNDVSKEIEVILNGKPVKLFGKENYILADVLPHYGKLPEKISSFKILLNGNDAGFTAEIKAGDDIKILL